MPTFLLDNAPEVPLKESEREGLIEIVRRRRLVVTSLVVPLPATIGVAAFAPRLLTLVIIGCLANLAFAILRHGLARCPRCGDFFNWLQPLTMECVACGLSLRKLQAPDRPVRE